MFCSKCGIENENNAQICSSCNHQLKEIIQVSPQSTIIVYAGFWRRFVAVCIDSMILIIGARIIGFANDVVFDAAETDLGTMQVFGEVITFQAVGGVVGVTIHIILNLLYFTLLESSSKQATLGKMAIGIIVTDLNGSRISFGKANARYWGQIVSFVILLIGFIMAGFTQKKQALHDIMAGTLVVKK